MAEAKFPECIVMDRYRVPPDMRRWRVAEATPVIYEKEFNPITEPRVTVMEYERDPVWDCLWWRIR